MNQNLTISLRAVVLSLSPPPAIFTLKIMISLGFELQINGFMGYILFSVCFLSFSVMFVRLAHAFVCGLSICIAVGQSTVGMHSIHSTSGCFQVRASTNNAALNVLVHIFGWTNAHVGVACTLGNGIAESWGRNCSALVDRVPKRPSWPTPTPPCVGASDPVQMGYCSSLPLSAVLVDVFQCHVFLIVVKYV